MPQYEPVKYIVENIECMQGEKGDLWVTSFVGKKPTLSEYVKPTWDIGDELPFKPKLIKAEPQWYYERSAETEKPKKTYPKQEKTYKADPEKLDSIERISIGKTAMEAYCKTTDDSVPWNPSHYREIYRDIKEVIQHGGDLPVVNVAKKEYGAVEQ